jgi:hypothetical protein
LIENNIDACLQLSMCYDGLEQPVRALDALLRSFH